MRDKNQVVLPLDLGICIPEGDFVFKVAEICESLDYTELFNTYLRSWRKVNPITMFELIVYGYMKHKYSGRDIAEACKTDIRFMWLLNGEPTPSHATISRFEDKKISEAIEGLFYQFVNKLCEMGEVKFKNLFVDGTKIEAYANKYTFVWKSAVEKNLVKLEKKISVLLSVLCERYGFGENISLEKCYEQLCLQAQWINLTFAAGKGKHKTQLQRDIEILKEYIDKKTEYCSHLGKFGKRNSFSKTDTDATFTKTGYRTIKVNQVILEHRPKVLEALTSEEGTLLRVNRSIQVEGVFGVLKEDYGFRRFLTRGKKNIETQFFFLAFALNIEKLCNRTKKGRIGLDLFALNAS